MRSTIGVRPDTKDNRDIALSLIFRLIRHLQVNEMVIQPTLHVLNLAPDICIDFIRNSRIVLEVHNWIQ